jgi:murein L,D-transpeptidase YafK
LRLLYILSIILFALVLKSDSKAQSFRDDQQKYPRVRDARQSKAQILDSLFEKSGLEYPPARIFLQAFKHERELELWASASDSFVLIKTYKFTAYCGTLGPKRHQGDLQIPEGFYFVDRFNPASNYHLSLGLNYPNKSDRIRKDRPDPGGDIFIHGNQVTIGCIPIGDDAIKELYISAVDAKSSGQNRIPVQIFPFRMDDKKTDSIRNQYIKTEPELEAFWVEIEAAYTFFQKNHILPDISIDPQGCYIIKP